MAPNMSKKRRMKGPVKSYYHAGMIHSQHQQGQFSNDTISQRQAQYQKYQSHYQNKQKSTNLLSHPIYNLPIPPVNAAESQILNDEADVYSFRQSALHKFKLNVDLLENIVCKSIPFDKIMPPTSFPNCVVGGTPIEANKTELSDELKQSIMNPGVGDSIFGNLEVIRAYEQNLKDQADALEKEVKPNYGLDELVDDKYLFEVQKLSDLHNQFSEYSAARLKDYENSMKEIEDDFKTKFQRKIKEEDRVRIFKVDVFEQKSISYADYKEKERKKKEKRDRIRREQEEELAERKRKESEEQARLEQEKKLQAEEEQRKLQEEASRRAAAAQAQSAAPRPAPGVSAMNVVDPSANFDDPFATEGNNGNFEFDNNLLYGSGDNLIMDDETGFGALEDQVFLSDLEGNLE